MTATGGYRLGIDLGTTYAAAAVARGDTAEVVGLGNRATAVPSVIHIAADGTALTGEAADRRGPSEPDRVAREFKRRIGDPTPLLLGGAPHSAEALTGTLLRWVIDKVSELEGGPPERIALTHPANWGLYKQDLFAQSIRLAGASAALTLTEPEAAAIAYAANERVADGSLIAVYDLGGGTFDAAVLRKVGDGFEILGRPEGIERLGGIDFDEAVIGHVREALGDALAELDPDDPATLAALTRLRRECVDAKEALSSDTETSIAVMLPDIQTQVRLTRAEFEQMVRPPLVATVDALRRALASADVEPADITSVLMVGGSSRIPLVAELVSDAFDRPIAIDAHPKHAIALGAAIALAPARHAAAEDRPRAVAAAVAAGVAASQRSDAVADDGDTLVAPDAAEGARTPRAAPERAANGHAAAAPVAAGATARSATLAAGDFWRPAPDDAERPAWALPVERGDGGRRASRLLLAAVGALALVALLVVAANAMNVPSTPTSADTTPPVEAVEVPQPGAADAGAAPDVTRPATSGGDPQAAPPAAGGGHDEGSQTQRHDPVADDPDVGGAEPTHPSETPTDGTGASEAPEDTTDPGGTPADGHAGGGDVDSRPGGDPSEVSTVPDAAAAGETAAGETAVGGATADEAAADRTAVDDADGSGAPDPAAAEVAADPPGTTATTPAERRGGG